MFEDLYCKIYVQTEKDGGDLLKFISSFTGGGERMRTIKTEQLEIDVIQNNDFNKEMAQQETGFVYYPYYLEIEPASELTDPHAYKAAIKSLLSSMKEQGDKVVPSCEFENYFR